MPKTAYDPAREELNFIAGDGLTHVHGSEEKGISSDTRLTKNAFAHPMIRYSGRFGEYVLEGDLYQMPLAAGKSELMLHIICPVCSTPETPHALRVTSSMKKMEYDNTRGVSVETFGCTWELPAAGSTPGALQFGMGLCKWRVAIENNRAYDA